MRTESGLDERPLERRQRGTQQRKRCSPSAPPLPRARPSPSTDARSRRRDPSPSAPARYAPPFSFSFVAFVARSLGERVISHQSVATVRSPRRGESASPRGADARRTRARVRRETTSRFFSHSSRPRRDRGFAHGGDARAASVVAS